MHIPAFPFQVTNWNDVAVETHAGLTGYAEWKVLHVGNIRVRRVSYSANYLADHWCHKGHIIYCINGSMETELADGRTFTLTAGNSYQVGDDSDAHRTYSKEGAELFIVD